MPESVDVEGYYLRMSIAIQSNKLILLSSQPYSVLATPQSVACMAMSYAVTRIIAFPVAVFVVLNLQPHIFRRRDDASKERLPSIVLLRDSRVLESLVHHRPVAVI